MLAVGIVLLVATAAVTAPWLAPYDPAAQLDLLRLKNAPPSLAHPFGTDAYSRDVLSRTLHGARASLLIGMLGATIAGLLATIIGLGAAWLPHGVGRATMGAADALRAIPRKIVLLTILLLVPRPSLAALAVLLGATSWTAMSRVIFVQARALRAREFLLAARATGVPPLRLLARHALPQLGGSIAAASAMLLADLLSLEAGLSFLGLGVRPPTASWGSMLQDGVPELASAWWTVVVPCTLLVLTVVSVAHLADRASDATLPPR